MMIVVAMSFIISWTPFYVTTLVTQVQQRSFLRDSNFLFTMLLIHWFGFLNSCINPIIYNFMNEKFHRSFKNMLSTLSPKCNSMIRKNSSVLYGSTLKSGSRGLERTRCVRMREAKPNSGVNLVENGVLYRKRNDLSATSSESENSRSRSGSKSRSPRAREGAYFPGEKRKLNHHENEEDSGIRNSSPEMGHNTNVEGCCPMSKYDKHSVKSYKHVRVMYRIVENKPGIQLD